MCAELYIGAFSLAGAHFTPYSRNSYQMLIAVGVNVFKSDAAEVTRDLAKLPEFFSVHLMQGPCDLELLVGLAAVDRRRSYPRWHFVQKSLMLYTATIQCWGVDGNGDRRAAEH